MGHHACGVREQCMGSPCLCVREQCMGSPCLRCKGAVYGVTMLVV